MKKESTPPAKALRQKSGMLLKNKQQETPSPLSETDTQKLLHELEVHQNELKRVNGELLLAKQQAELAAKEMVKESEELFKQVFEASNVGKSITLPSGEINVNKAFCKMLGYSPDELKNKKWQDLTPPHEVPDTMKIITSLLNGEKNEARFKKNYIHKNGSWIWTDVSVALLRDHLGKPLHFITTIVDISEQKQAEESLKQSEFNFRKMVENAPFGMHFYEYIQSTDQLVFTGSNPAADTILGVDNSQFVGKTITEAFPELAKTEVPQRYKDAAKSNLFWSTEQIDYQDDSIAGAFEIKAFQTGPGKMVSIFMDITERKESERLLQKKTEEIESQNQKLNKTNQELAAAKEIVEENEARLKMAMEVSRSGVWDWDILKNTLLWSDEFLQLFGLPENTIAGFEAWTKALHPDDVESASAKIQEAIENHTDLLNDYRIILPNKEIRWIRATGHTTYINNKPARMVGLCMDITWQKKAEISLEQKNANITSIIEGTKESVWALDRNYEILFINKTFQTEFKQSFGVWLEPGVNLLDSHPETIRAIWKTRYDRMLTNEQFTVEDTVDTENGMVYVHITFNPIVRNGEVIGGTCIGSNVTERKLAEQELINAKERAEIGEQKLLKTNEEYRRSNQLLDESQSIAKVGGWEFDIVNNKLYWTAETYRIHDTAPQEFNPGLDEVVSYFLSESKKQISDALELAITQGTGYDLILETYTTKGRRIDVRATCKTTLVDGKPIKLTGIFQDITAQKQAEEALKRSEERYALVIDASEQGIWDWNVETNEVFFSEQWKKQIGYKDHELKNEFNTWIEHLHPDEREYCQNAVFEYLNQPVEHFFLKFRFRHKDGTYRWIHNKASSLKNDKGKVIRMFGTHTDITELKQAEMALKESEIHSRSIIEAIPDLMFVLDSEGVYLDFKADVADLAIQKESIIGRKNRDMMPPDFADLIDEKIKCTLQTGSMQIFEYQLELPRKGPGYFEARMVQCGNNRVLAIVRNITERKISDAKIRQSNEQLIELNATKDKFFNIIAHDLKSPFNSIVGFSDLLVDMARDKDYDEMGKYAGIIHQSSHRAIDLLVNLMEWARSQTGRIEFNPEIFEMDELFNDVVKLLSDNAAQKGITITKTLPSRGIAKADKAMISTVLRNLVANAIKFTKPGGEIFLSVSENNSGITVAVKDNGIGIPANLIDKLFRLDECFTTRGTEKEQGTGLGLILCKEFIEKHEGTIWAESTEGKGSIFSFSLPG